MTEAQLHGVYIVFFIHTLTAALHFFCNIVAAYDQTGILVKARKKRKKRKMKGKKKGHSKSFFSILRREIFRGKELGLAGGVLQDKRLKLKAIQQA